MSKNQVVIVDDDEDLLRLLVSAFQAQGFETKGVTTGKEALKILLDETQVASTCLFILDRMLPDMDGLDILKQFRDKFPNQVPVLILSTLSSEKDILEGLKKGAVDYISKPFSLPILLEKALKLVTR